MKILVVDDDEQLVDLLKVSLTAQHYSVDVASDGQEGWDLVQSVNYDLIVLDVMLPKLDGVSFCRQLRAQGNSVRVLLLTARGTSSDKIVGLDAGADDYIVKPIALQELEARIRALLRRQTPVVTSVLRWGSLCLNLESCEATYRNLPLALTAKEYALLELLIRNPQRVYSQSTILSQLWSLEEDLPGEEAVRTHIKRLRQKLRSLQATELIETVYGLGYRLNPAFGDRPESKPPSQPELVSHPPNLAEIAVLWQKSQPKLLDRLKPLQQAAQSLSQNALTEELRQQGQRECHKLMGSLGMLGLTEGAAIARQIQTILQSWEILNQQEGLLQTYVASLSQIIEQGNPSYSDGERVLPLAASQDLEPSARQGLKVMVVDDDRLILHLLKAMLESSGFQVATLSDPQKFWQTLEEIEPDLLILDIQMPKVDGIELCRAIRKNLYWAWLPILFLTGQQDLDTARQIFAAGADDYLAKPIAALELITRIVNRLERTRLLQSRC